LNGWTIGPHPSSAGGNIPRAPGIRRCALFLWIAIVLASTSVPARAQSQPAPPTSKSQPSRAETGSISGTVIDQAGAFIANAKVVADAENSISTREAHTDGDGHFVFDGLEPGTIDLKITAPGFAQQQMSVVLHPAENYVIPQIMLPVATATIDVQVLPPDQIAELEVKAEEKQRLLGVVPNFYVTYEPHPVALSPRQKLQLAWKTTIDPVSFAITAGIAGIEQADNEFSGYGQGAQGYGKRFGAAYADFVAGTFIGSAFLPVVLKQDPRYFYKGTGSRTHRLLYAMANAFVCKGDNGRWQPNYSSILGGVAAGGISNLYYPAKNRNGAGLTFENAFIAVGAGAIGNVIQEFFLRKLTPHVPPPDPTLK
jgi:hypothetical protein